MKGVLDPSANLRLHALKGLPDHPEVRKRMVVTRLAAERDEELSDLIEWNIGRDLQYIRINGTLVGALIGFVLFWLGWLASRWSIG